MISARLNCFLERVFRIVVKKHRNIFDSICTIKYALRTRNYTTKDLRAKISLIGKNAYCSDVFFLKVGIQDFADMATVLELLYELSTKELTL